jgi:hypothetical protein
MDVNVDKSKIEIDTTDDHEWVEIIRKTANEICNDPDCNRINEQNAGFIIASDDAGVSESLGWAIERHLNDFPSKLKLMGLLGKQQQKRSNRMDVMICGFHPSPLTYTL